MSERPNLEPWVLDMTVTPTDTVTHVQVAEALNALQIKGVAPRTVGTGADGKILVALVKHLRVMQGFYPMADSTLDEQHEAS